jgi:predicted TIM-barrel fold metal-dependent hydrolase
MESEAVLPKKWLESVYEYRKQWYGEEAFEKAKATFDSRGRVEMLIRDMNEVGVDKSVAAPLDLSVLCQEEPEISVWRGNEYVAEAQSKYPERIIGFVGVDPLRKDAVELLEKGITEWGLKGVKIFPSTFRPTDDTVQLFMRKVNELEVPVLFHQGADPGYCLMKYVNPVDLEPLILNYPKMKIIAAHCARGYEDTLVAMMVFRKRRIYTDLAALQDEYIESPWRFTLRMRYLMDRIPDAILMGSDWPFVKTPPASPTHKEWFDAIRNLKIPEKFLELGLGIKDFSKEEKGKILGENARALLNL